MPKKVVSHFFKIPQEEINKMLGFFDLAPSDQLSKLKSFFKLSKRKEAGAKKLDYIILETKNDQLVLQKMLILFYHHTSLFEQISANLTSRIFSIFKIKLLEAKSSKFDVFFDKCIVISKMARGLTEKFFGQIGNIITKFFRSEEARICCMINHEIGVYFANRTLSSLAHFQGIFLPVCSIFPPWPFFFITLKKCLIPEIEKVYYLIESKQSKELSQLKSFLFFNENIKTLKLKFEDLSNSFQSAFKLKIKNHIFLILDKSDATFGKLVSRRVFDLFEPLELSCSKAHEVYGDFLKHSLISFIEQSTWMEDSLTFEYKAYSAVRKLLLSVENGKKRIRPVKKFLGGKISRQELLQFKESGNNNHDNIIFSLSNLMHLAGQLFYLVVVPNPFCFRRTKLEVEGKEEIHPEKLLLEMTLRHRPLYLQILGAHFPEYRKSHLFEYVYLKMETHFWNLLEGWKLATLKSNLALLNPLLDFPSDPQIHNKQREVLLENLEPFSRLTLKKQVIYFVNGFLSKNLNHFDYFKDFFSFFPFLNKKVIRWNAECLDLMSHSRELNVLLTGVYYMITSLVSGRLTGTLAIMSAVRTLMDLTLKYKQTSEKAKSSSETAFELILNANKESPESINFICFSLGSELVFHLLKHVLKNGNGLLVNNVVFISAVLCQQELQQRIGQLIGPNGLVKGKIIIVRSKFDLILYFFIYKMMGRKPLGLNSFSYKKAVRNLKSQSLGFSKKTDEEVFEYVKSKIVEIDLSHHKMGHLDVSKNFAIISRQIEKYWSYENN